MSKTTALHVHHVHFFGVHDYDVKPPNATFYRGRGHKMTNSLFLF